MSVKVKKGRERQFSEELIRRLLFNVSWEGKYKFKILVMTQFISQIFAECLKR